MKKYSLLIALIISSLTAFPQLKFVLDYATFQTIEGQAYLEVYLAVSGTTITYEVDSNKNLSGSVEITYLIQDGEKVLNYEKYRLNTPSYVKLSEISDLIDLKRMSITNGEYTFTVVATDVKSEETVEKSFKLRNVNYNQNELIFSEIQLANHMNVANTESIFYKNGYLISPNFTHYYKDKDSTLFFYAELYNSLDIFGEDNKFILEHRIVSNATGEVVGDFRGVKRQDPQDLIPLIYSFDLRELPSGSYSIILEARNQQNKIMASQKVNFENRNTKLLDFSNVSASNSFVDSITNIAELKFYIRTLSPISSSEEKTFAENQLEYADLNFMQRYFLNFWQNRNLTDPEKAWLDYKKEVEKVDELFGYGNVRGFQTERGRVYLQYGKPNIMRDVPYEYNTYPYSIWQYDQLDGQTNRKFLFYSPSMEMLGYEILQSNVMGEVINHNWEFELENRTTSGINRGREIEYNEVVNYRARDLWDNPR